MLRTVSLKLREWGLRIRRENKWKWESLLIAEDIDCWNIYIRLQDLQPPDQTKTDNEDKDKKIHWQKYKTTNVVGSTWKWSRGWQIQMGRTYMGGKSINLSKQWTTFSTRFVVLNAQFCRYAEDTCVFGQGNYKRCYLRLPAFWGRQDLSDCMVRICPNPLSRFVRFHQESNRVSSVQ